MVYHEDDPTREGNLDEAGYEAATRELMDRVGDAGLHVIPDDVLAAAMVAARAPRPDGRELGLTGSAAGITYDATGWLSSYGPFAYGPNIIVIHSLECDAIDHIAEQLSARGGWLDGEGLAPQRMTDPVSIVKCIPDGNQGGHIGGPGNSHCAGVETSGRAAWTPAQWATPKARAAVDHQARAVAGLAIQYGWDYSDLRYLSLAQIRAGSPRGICDHNSISLSGISNTDHWDVGLGYPWSYLLTRTRYWYQLMTGGTPDPPKDDSMSAADVTALKTYIKTYIDGKFTDLAAALAAVRSEATTGRATDAAGRGLIKTTVIEGNTAGTVAHSAISEVVIASRVEAKAGRSVITAIRAEAAAAAKAAKATEARIEAMLNTLTDTQPARPASYTLLVGDTLSAVAARFGLSLPQLLAANPTITNPDDVSAAMVLVIPLP